MQVISFVVEPIYIKDGKAGSCSLCPVALQLKARYPNSEVRVHGDYVMMDGEKWVDNDGMLSDFITTFDKDEKEIRVMDVEASEEHHKLMESWLEHGCPIALRLVE